MKKNDLNKQQQLAVETHDGPLLIFAGAGSGKTMVITHRIAKLIAGGISPHEILSVTFTNKAAQEMKNRVKKLIGDKAMSVWISTFHAFCSRLLRKEMDDDFTIFDEKDQAMIIKEVLKKLDLDPKKFNPYKIREIISQAKNNLMDIESFRLNAAAYSSSTKQTVAEIYDHYQQFLKNSNGFDFDDLIIETINMLKNNKDILEKYRQRFKYLMVDEYQDTNYAQYTLIKLLAPPQNNVCVVGDDDQSIYSWRGADIRNILEFEKHFNEAKTLKLEENYRSTQNILDAAHRVIKNNPNRADKKLWTRRTGGEEVRWQEFFSARDEAKAVIGEIESLFNQGFSAKDIAIFYRVNAQSRSFEDVLRAEGINYKVVGGLKFYSRKEIKDILAYMRVIVNPKDDVSMERIINVPARGIGKKTVEELKRMAIENGKSLFEIVKDDSVNIPDKIGKKLVNIKALFRRLLETYQEDDASLLCKEIIELSGYHRMLEEDEDIQSRSKLENIEELVSAFSEDENREKTVKEILNEIALITDVDSWSEFDEYITLMTVHLAKGLEFPVVFLTGMEEELFPHYDALSDPVQMEEERRLCYVGMTRAKDILYLTSASQRMLYGQTRWHIPSRFIREAIGNPGETDKEDDYEDNDYLYESDEEDEYF